MNLTFLPLLDLELKLTIFGGDRISPQGVAKNLTRGKKELEEHQKKHLN